MSTRLHTCDTSSLSLILPIMVIAPVDLSMSPALLFYAIEAFREANYRDRCFQLAEKRALGALDGKLDHYAAITV